MTLTSRPPAARGEARCGASCRYRVAGEHARPNRAQHARFRAACEAARAAGAVGEKETFEIARALQPALVVLEDVDLVGGHRDGPFAVGGGTLNLLRNEMDGVPSDARMLFLLTTNRPEVLEPALAARPGRVDQVIEIGLPGEAERRLLVERYAGGLRISEDLAAATSAKVGRVSPAFIKELMRRAAQAMLERGGDEALEAQDIDRALADMLGAGGRLAARMLGAEAAIGFADVV